MTGATLELAAVGDRVREALAAGWTPIGGFAFGGDGLVLVLVLRHPPDIFLR